MFAMEWLLCDVCSLGRRSSIVICKAVIADQLGLLRQGDVWTLEIAQNPVFSRIKWLPASIGGTSFAARARFALGWRKSGPHCQCCAEVIFTRFHALCHCVW